MSTAAFLTREQEQTASPEVLVTAYQPLVNRIARRLAKFGGDEDDLRQEGMIGLLEAAKRFDPAKGFRFGTYARWWALSTMTDFMTKNHLLTGMSSKAKRAFFKTRPGRDVSIETPLGENRTLADTFICPEPTPEQILESSDEDERLSSRVKLAFAGLPDREVTILRRRYMEDEGETLKAISVDLGISHERVRQLEQRAMGKMREALAHV